MQALAPSLPALRRPVLARLPALEVPAAWLLGFAPVTYLGLAGGGYDIVARSELALVLWWVLLLGALTGVLPRARLGRAAWGALALLAGFALWSWLSAGWSSSSEDSLAEASRAAGYLGVLALGLALSARAEVLRPLLAGLACAITTVAALAVLSRLVPSWFPADDAVNFYATSRLSYPFDYADAVGEFAALGLPLLLALAADARTIVGRALAAAGLPVLVLCLGLTVSRGGLLAAAVGLVCFFALVPDRLPRLAIAGLAAAGSAVVMDALLRRPPVRDGFVSANAAGARHDVLAVLILASAGVGLSCAGVGLLARHARRPRWLAPSGRRAAVAGGVVVLAVLAAIVVAVGSGFDHRVWEDFKKPSSSAHANQYFRLFSVSGSHRYQYWQAAVSAFDAHPLNGTGAGTFQYTWSRHNTLAEFVRNAHSLYVETLAELGIVGELLIGGLVVLVLLAGCRSTLRAPPSRRFALAACTAGFAGFAAAAAFDWVWQIGAIPFAGLLLAAGALSGSSTGRPRISGRAVAAVVAVLAGLLVAVPLAMTADIRSSQAAARAGNPSLALADARAAQRVEPGAAGPRLQRALVLETAGDLAGARQAIGEAEARRPLDWRIWLTASRLETEAGHPAAALALYRRAGALNPSSPLFK